MAFNPRDKSHRNRVNRSLHVWRFGSGSERTKRRNVRRRMERRARDLSRENVKVRPVSTSDYLKERRQRLHKNMGL